MLLAEPTLILILIAVLVIAVLVIGVTVVLWALARHNESKRAEQAKQYDQERPPASDKSPIMPK